MNLHNVVVTDVTGVVTVFSESGKTDSMTDRATYGLSLCKEGRIVYEQNGIEYVSDKSVAVILPKHGSYSIHRRQTGYFPVINFDCKGLACDTVTVIPIEDPDALLTDYERMRKLFFSSEDRLLILSIFYEMLHMIFDRHVPYELKSAMAIIKSGYSDPTLTNVSVAERCGISEVYLRKLFDKHLSCSPKRFLINLRIKKAMQMLLERDRSIADIADECGFSSPSHFCKAFKQRMHMTPTEYMRRFSDV